MRTATTRILGRASGLFCALALVAALAGQATAANDTLTFGVEMTQQQPVEQQSPNFFFCGGSAGPIYCPFTPETWVYNPTAPGDPYATNPATPACIWDVDDGLDVVGSGSVSGAVSGSACLIADGKWSYSWDRHAVQVSVRSPSPSLVVTVTNDRGVSYVLTPVKGPRATYFYTLCARDETMVDSFPEVAGSNGGVGVTVTYTITLSSPKKLNGVFAVMQLGNGNFGIC